MTYTVNEIGTITVESGGGLAGDWGSGWSSSNYYHITDLDTAGAAQLHSFVLFYKGTQTDTGTTDVAIPLFGDKTNSGAIILGIDNGYVAISDGTTITRGTSLVNDDEWQSIVFTVGDTTINAYVNGTKEITITPTASEMSNIIINAIGYAAGTSVGPSGLDGIQVYDKFLFDFMVADYESNIYPAAAVETLTTFINNNSSDVNHYINADDWSGSGNITDNYLGTTWVPSTVTLTQEDGVNVFNAESGLLTTSAQPSTWPQNYTAFALIKWRVQSSDWRTLWRGVSNDHLVIVQQGATDLGMYSNRNGAFRDTGYNISPGNWAALVIVGQGDSATASTGTQTYYIDGVQVGTTDRVVSGTSIYRMGWTSQAPGKIHAFGGLDRALTSAEVTDLSTKMIAALTPSSSSGTAATFITESIILSQQLTQETANTTVPIDTDFVPIPVQTNKSMAIMEVQLRNSTLEDDIIFNKVYMNHNLNNEEDKLAHRVNVVVPFAVLQKVREKWS